MMMGQSGQYNLERSIRRKDPFVTRYSEIKFCTELISMVFLLNRNHVPFYKWMYRSLQELNILGEYIHQKIGTLVYLYENSEKLKCIRDICDSVINELKNQGMTDSNSSFLPDHWPLIHERIQDNILRRSNVWVE